MTVETLHLLDRSFQPRWWQRRAYIEGLRDAQRIAEKQAWAHTKEGIGAERNCRVIVMVIQDRITALGRKQQ